jgi:hypothetical protein
VPCTALSAQFDQRPDLALPVEPTTPRDRGNRAYAGRRPDLDSGDNALSATTSDIFFANVQHFRRDLYAALAARDPKPSIVLIDASRRYLFELTAHQIVRDMVADLRAQGFEIWVVLPRGEAGEAIGRFRHVFVPADAQLFPTISDAIEAHLDQLDGLTD